MSQELPESPLVSVVVNNYNYARFLREAVDSALDQTYSNVEVVVVDDGSIDDSREVIANYGDKIIPVLKENGGQASALNAGFVASRGEIVVFLDADDVLLPDTVRRVVEAFQIRPDVAKVQYRMRLIDATGKPTGEFHPPGHLPMPSGDLRKYVMKFQLYTFSATSGSAYASSVLRQILPIPEARYRISADLYLFHLDAVFGPIVSLDEAGVLYRIHGTNNWFHSKDLTDLAYLRDMLLKTAHGRAEQERLFDALYSVDVRESMNLDFLRDRVISLKLDSPNHPFEERLSVLCLRGCTASIVDPLALLYSRVLYFLWFAIMFFAPKALAKSLAEMTSSHEKRGRLLNKLLPLLRRIR